jgi:hypothetical protein
MTKPKSKYHGLPVAVQYQRRLCDRLTQFAERERHLAFTIEAMGSPPFDAETRAKIAFHNEWADACERVVQLIDGYSPDDLERTEGMTTSSVLDSTINQTSN